MKVADLTAEQLTACLTGDGLLVPMGPFVLRMRTCVREIHPSIHLLYAHYPIVEEGGIVDFDVRLSPTSQYQKLRRAKVAFFIDDRQKFDAFERPTALPMLEWIINFCVFMQPNQYFILHAGVLERDGKGVVIPGPPGAGKSTLTAALSLRGWRLLSDEVAVFRPGSPQLVPVVRPIGLKNESIDVIRAYEPAAVLGPTVPETRKGAVAHVQPNEESVRRMAELATPRCIVFPSYEAGAPCELTATTKARTLLRLGQDGFNFSLLGKSAFNTLADFVEISDCYELNYSDLDEAIEAIEQACEVGEKVLAEVE